MGKNKTIKTKKKPEAKGPKRLLFYMAGILVVGLVIIGVIALAGEKMEREPQ